MNTACLRSICGIWICFVLCTFPLFLHAQSTSSVQLRTTPNIPGPNEEVTVALDSYAFNYLGSTINWYINGVRQTNDTNKSKIVLHTGDVGVQKTIVARITQNDGAVVRTERTITPLRVDLILHAHTQTPYFYKGGALPSAGSPITATALVFNTTQEPADYYHYKWTVNGNVVQHDPTQRSNSVTYTSEFEKQLRFAVTVTDKNGYPVAYQTQTVPVVAPEVYFYMANPLRGLLPVALPKDTYFPGNDMTIRAISYYLDTSNPQLIQSQWKLNGESVETTGRSNQIELQKAQDSGAADISYKIYNTDQLLQTAQQSTVLHF